MDPDPWRIVPDWPAPALVRALATTRRLPGHSQPPYQRCNLGARSGDAPEHVRGNRDGLPALLNLPSAPVWLHQVHGTDVLREPIAGTSIQNESRADAAVTRQPGTVLAVLSADCLPVLFASQDGSVVAAAHAGWRGLAAGVLENTITACTTDPAHLLAWLGPAIGARRYEVGAEVRDGFLERDADAAIAFHPSRPGHWLCDLYALARRRLHAAGVTHIHGGSHCTYEEADTFYSHRRDGVASGRQACLIWITTQPAGSR